jgi:hypothetical protein
MRLVFGCVCLWLGGFFIGAGVVGHYYNSNPKPCITDIECELRCGSEIKYVYN